MDADRDGMEGMDGIDPEWTGGERTENDQEEEERAPNPTEGGPSSGQPDEFDLLTMEISGSDLESSNAHNIEAMETTATEEESAEQKKKTAPAMIQGHLLGYNGGILFLTFPMGPDRTEVCLFRAHRIFFDQRRVQPHEVKNKDRVEALVKAKLEGRLLSARVERMEKEDALYKTIHEEEVRPKWYSHCVWTGEEPTPEQKAPNNIKDEGNKSAMQQSNVADQVRPEEIKAQTGTMVAHNLAGSGIIKFDHNGQTSYAQFYMKFFLQDGALIKGAEFRAWKMDHTVEVRFNAFKPPTPMQAFVIKIPTGASADSESAMETEVMYCPTWRCSVVWSGSEPTPAVLDQVTRKQRKKGGAKDPSDAGKEQEEYVCGPLTHFVDRSTGVIVGKNTAVLFKLQDLVIDGQPVDANSRLSTLCQAGDLLFSHVKPLVPTRTIGDVVCDRIAVEIWKGKKNKKSGGEPTPMDASASPVKAEDAVSPPSGSKKHTYPMPSAATHLNQVGVITEVQNVLGKIKLSSVDPMLNGKMVLLSKNRLFVNGQRIRFKEFLTNNVQVGERLYFDMVRADEEESQGEYEWLALLAWKTEEKPSAEQIKSELGTGGKIIFRAKLLKFDDRSEAEGFTSGVLQIVSGPQHLGERVIFHREHTYVFGARMARADLYYVMKENDKVQLDFEVLEQATVRALEQKYGCEIKYRANMVWIGPMPRLEEDCDRFPEYMGGAVLPFLQKRQMDEELFTRLIQGKMKPKAYSPSPADRVKEKLPPNQIMAKVSELKRPDVGTSHGTTHGVMTLENGPMAGQKTFFARSHITIFGHSMSKADLMYIVRETDRFFVEVRAGTNNKNVPNVLVSAWIGQQPSDKNKAVPADANNAAFRAWLEEHDFSSFDRFKQCVNGELPPKPFHPLPLEVQIGRITYLYPHNKPVKGGGTDAGIIKIHQGSMAKRDVLFERENVFIWGVQFRTGDISHVLKEGDKVMVEVIEISGKERKKRQVKLNTTHIPKYVATLVYIGGGRPKPQDTSSNHSMEELDKNQNIKQWLNKRGKDIAFFASLMAGQLLPKVQQFSNVGPPVRFNENGFSQAPPPPTVLNVHLPPYNGEDPPPRSQREHSPTPYRGNLLERRDSYPRVPPPINHHMRQQTPLSHSHAMDCKPSSTFESFTSTSSTSGGDVMNPVMVQAQHLLKRVMACTSPEDSKVERLIEDQSQLQLALFISKTLEVASKKYQHRITEQYRDPGPIGPPKRNDNYSGRPLEKRSESYGMDQDYGNYQSSTSRSSHHDSLWQRQNQDRFSPSRDFPRAAFDEPSFSTGASGRGSDMFKPYESPSSSFDGHSQQQQQSQSGRRLGGLFGLQQPLHEYEESNGQKPDAPPPFESWESGPIRRPQRRESPVEFSQGTMYMEPPLKKFQPKWFEVLRRCVP